VGRSNPGGRELVGGVRREKFLQNEEPSTGLPWPQITLLRVAGEEKYITGKNGEGRKKKKSSEKGKKERPGKASSLHAANQRRGLCPDRPIGLP